MKTSASPRHRTFRKAPSIWLFTFFALINLLLLLSANTPRATAATLTNSSVTNIDYVVQDRGLHHRQWARVERYRDPATGQIAAVTNIAYVELATGMHYVDPATGKFVESRELIEPIPGGAVARYGQHLCIFSNDLATAGAIQMKTPDGKRLVSNLIGLSYFDASTDQHVLIAEVKSSQGQIIGSNQVLYADAMTDIPCSVRYTYTKGGFEQDIILKDPANLPTPGDFGLNPATTRLVVLTEFLNPPQPVKEVDTMNTNSPSTISDENLDFGVTQIRAGKAFSLGTNAPRTQIKIYKQWVTLEGRQFLAEQIRVPDLAKAVAAQATNQSAAIKRNVKGTMFAANTHNLPTFKTSNSPSAKKPMETASLREAEGFLLDYSQNITGPMTFLGGTNYYVSGNLTLSGTTTFEGNTIIKFAPAAVLSVSDVICNTGPNRMAILTSKNDDSVGEIISDSSHSPTTGTGTYINASLSGNTYKYLRLSYAGKGMQASSFYNGIWHCQFLKCTTGIFNSDDGGGTSLYNVLFSGCTTSVATIGGVTVYGQHVTSDSLYFNALSSVYLVNSIVPYSTLSGFKTLISSDTSGATLFQTVGAANYYIRSPTPGTASSSYLNPTLRNNLKTKTVFPPTQVDANISAATVWNQTAPRDTGSLPWIGYHYDPIDYAIGQKTLSATLTVGEGVCVGIYGTPGITVLIGGKVFSQGSPINMNRFIRYQSVQEQSLTWGNIANEMTLFAGTPFTAVPAEPNPPEVRMRFTEISFLANTQIKRYIAVNGSSQSTFARIFFQDCQFYNPALFLLNEGGGAPAITVCFTNNLLVRPYIYLEQDTSTDAIVVQAWNNLFQGGAIYFDNWTGSSTWYVRDNFFDKVSTLYGSSIQHSYNAYVTSYPKLAGSGNTDKTISSADYLTGTLGSTYYPTMGGNLATLFNGGSRAASAAGLYHHTLKTTNLKEGEDPAITTVTIGFHYVALDSTGLLADYDGDGLPDYSEDANGNGQMDAGESNWQTSINGLTSASPLDVFTPLK